MTAPKTKALPYAAIGFAVAAIAFAATGNWLLAVAFAVLAGSFIANSKRNQSTPEA